MSVMLYPCILCVTLLMYLFVLCVACLTVFVNCLVKQFVICFGVVAILLLNVMAVFSVGGGCCFLPTPMTLASGGSSMFPHVVHQPASPSIWPAVQSLRRGLSTNPGATMWCVCGCS